MDTIITSMDAGTQLIVNVTYLEQFAIQQLYDSLTDMDFELTAKQHSVFEKIRDAKDASTPSFTSPTEEEFNAAYPEPQGDPSY